jgi:YfiH family protein
MVIAVSERGLAPEGDPSPTAFLARRLARTLGLPAIPIVRATQVHGTAAHRVREAPAAETVLDVGSCDILVTTIPGVALVVQTADCVPVVLAGPGAVGMAHAGWRGSARNAAGAAVEEMSRAGIPPSDLRAWLGPSIGPCCYEVGGEVAAQFAGEFARRSCGGRYTLDLPAVNRSQLEAAGVPAANISAHPACTRCGGEKFASYRRDGAAAGRMISLVALL